MSDGVSSGAAPEPGAVRPRSSARRGWNRVLRILVRIGVMIVILFVGTTLADLGPNLWRHLRFHDVVREPWDEITTDAVVLDERKVAAFQGTSLSIFEADGKGRFRPVYSKVLAQFLHRLVVRPPWGFTTAGDKGFGILDFSNLDHPEVVTYLAPPSDREKPVYGYDMAVHGDRVLVAARAGGFFVADVSDPRHPKLVGSQATPGVGQGAALDDHSGWVSVGGYGVVEIDLASGAALTSKRIAAVPPDATGLPEPPPFDVAVRRPYVYFGLGNFGLGIARTDGQPVPPDLLPLPKGAHIRGASVDGDLLCIADYASGVFLADVADPEHPRLVGHVPMAGTPVHVDCRDRKMVVTRGAQGFALYDLADLNAPRLVGEFRFDGFSHFVELFGNHAAVAKGSGGVDLYELAPDGTPRLVANIPTRGTTQHVMVHDGRAYVSEVTGGLTVWDLSNPAAPRFIETFEIEQHVRRTETFGSRIVTVGGEGPVSVLVYGADGHLSRTHKFARKGYAWRAIRAGGAVWVAALHHGLGYVALDGGGEPAWHEAAKMRDGVDEPLSLAADGDTLYVGDLGAIVALDVSHPENPQVIGRKLGLGITYPVGLAVDGNRLYVAAHGKGLLVVELDGTRLKRVIARCETAAPLMAVAARDGKVWIAPGSEPLRLVDPLGASSGCSRA